MISLVQIAYSSLFICNWQVFAVTGKCYIYSGCTMPFQFALYVYIKQYAFCLLHNSNKIHKLFNFCTLLKNSVIKQNLWVNR